MQMQGSLYEVAGGMSESNSRWGACGLHYCWQADPRCLSFSYLNREQVSLFLLYTQVAGKVMVACSCKSDTFSLGCLSSVK